MVSWVGTRFCRRGVVWPRVWRVPCSLSCWCCPGSLRGRSCRSVPPSPRRRSAVSCVPVPSVDGPMVCFVATRFCRRGVVWPGVWRVSCSLSCCCCPDSLRGRSCRPVPPTPRRRSAVSCVPVSSVDGPMVFESWRGPLFFCFFSLREIKASSGSCCHFG